MNNQHFCCPVIGTSYFLNHIQKPYYMALLTGQGLQPRGEEELAKVTQQASVRSKSEPRTPGPRPCFPEVLKGTLA